MDSDGIRKVVRSVSHGLLSDFWIDGLGSMFYGTTRGSRIIFDGGNCYTYGLWKELGAKSLGRVKW